MEKVWYPGNLVTGTARKPSGTERETSGTERETSGTAGGTWEGKAAQQPPIPCRCATMWENCSVHDDVNAILSGKLHHFQRYCR